ncbi:MAG: T9SS type A sorting domain-containing protein [Bacteroidota bacterium]|nr:T9SS type A sorting domain-containing protein [Bacteroidota bacterium]
MLNLKRFAVALLLVVWLPDVFSQSATCIESEPFCTGTNYTFPASVNAPPAEDGPDYDCLTNQPNPVWYHLLIDNSGDLIIDMFSTPSHDIDFICWGPFTNPTDPCPYGLDENHVVCCSYSISSTETCIIDGAVSGEYYILMITNFSNQACNINFSQTGGTGSTDCSILPPQISSNSPVCEGGVLELMAASVDDAEYSWTGPNNFSSNQQNITITDVTLDYSGEYTLIITVNGLDSSPIMMDVVINPLPEMSAGDDTEIPFGTSTQLNGSVNGSPTDFSYLWQPEELLLDATIINPTTVNLEVTTEFELTVTNIDTDCVSTDATLVTVTGDALATIITADYNEICLGEEVHLNAEASGGSGDYTYLWSSDPVGFSSEISNPTVIPTVTTTYFVAVNDGYNIVDAEFTVIVNLQPVIDAGDNISIPFGTNTQLDGSVDGNLSDFSFLWQPEEFLLDATIINPTTVNLVTTTEYELTATNINTGCFSKDNTTVIVTGGTVSATITADIDEICCGEAVTIKAQASGGSGDYTYSWSSVPAGFSSELYNPTVVPEVTTTYFVTVNDGYNSVDAEFTITVNPLPIACAGEDIIISYGTDTQLQGSASSGSGQYYYKWNNAEFLLQDDVPNPSTIVLEEDVNFLLYITDDKACVSETDMVNVSLTGGALSVISSYAVKPELCFGDTTQLIAMASGGSGEYSYTWKDEEGNIVSNSIEMEIIPEISSVYTVIVEDGYNVASSDVAVSVYPLPVVDLAPEGYNSVENTISICVFDTVTLDAGNAGVGFYSYLWSDGYDDQTREIGTTGISFDIQEYCVDVNVKYSDILTCVSAGNITALFSYAECDGNDGIEELKKQGVSVYPIPSKGLLHVDIENWHNDFFVEINDVVGQTILSDTKKASYNGVSKFEIDLLGYQKGLYILKIYNEKKSVQVKVLIQ